MTGSYDVHVTVCAMAEPNRRAGVAVQTPGNDPAEVASRTAASLGDLEQHLQPWLDLYQDLHAHPELSMQEYRTAQILAASLGESGLAVTERVGGTGVVGLLANGPGPIVMIRGDMDALPIREETGLPYASRQTGRLPSGEQVHVMHACGHDMHTACLAATARALAASRSLWSGTVMVVGQPGEETVEGARAMLADGLFTRFPKPNLALGQHVMPLPIGTVAHGIGPVLAGTASIEVRVFGHGGHGSAPAACIDPVVTAAHLITRLQTIVSRETPANDPVVLTTGILRAGTKANIIPDDATITLNVRAKTDEAMRRTIGAIRRIAVAESAASGCGKEPEITVFDRGPATVNDATVTATVAATHTALLGADRVRPLVPFMGSEDFPEFGVPGGDYPGDPVPYCFWLWGGVDGGIDDGGDILRAEVASNHTSKFQLDAEPTLRVGMRLLTSAALSFLQLP
jgi:amidohydrolase